MLNAITSLIATLLIVSLVMVVPVNAASKTKKPAKVKNVKVTAYKAQLVTFGDGRSNYIAPAKISWSKAKRAKTYQVAYRKGASSWIYLTTKSKSITIKNTSTFSKNLKPDTTYKVKVRAKNGKKYGKWSTTKKFTTKKVVYYQPGTVKNVRVTEKCESKDGYSPVVLKWDRATYGQKYEVAYKTGHNDWTVLTSETDTCKIEPLNPYCKYSFKVRAVNGSKRGNWSDEITAYTRVNTVEIDFPTKTELSLHRGIGSLKLSWKTTYPEKIIVDNKNVRFNVYASLDSTEEKNWTLVAENVKGNEYTQLHCDRGSNYYFKVLPVDNISYKEFEYTGEYSNVVSGEVNQIEGLVISQHYTDQNDEYKLNRSYNTRGLMLHSVGGNIETAQEWFDLYNGSMKDTASVHGFIDGATGELWQTLDWYVRAGHAGPAGNNRYIGIEMCESQYLQYEDDYVTFTVEPGHMKDAQAVAKRTYESAVKLFATLCDYYGFDPLEKGTVVSHYEWGTMYEELSGGGHMDPEHMWNQLKTGYTMDGFRQDVAKLLKKYK